MQIEVEQFCHSMEVWAIACMTELPTDSDAKREWRSAFRKHWEFLHIAIQKSCLLDRLIYGGETLRTEICPEHKGKWSGIPSTPEGEPVMCPHRCNHGIELTGWVQNSADPKSENRGVKLVHAVLPDVVVTEVLGE